MAWLRLTDWDVAAGCETPPSTPYELLSAHFRIAAQEPSITCSIYSESLNQATAIDMSHPLQPQNAIFHLVLAKFKASLNDHDRRQFGATTLHDLEVAIASIQQKQLSERKLRAMSKLGRFLEGMQEYDKIVAVFLNTSEILAFVWVRCCSSIPDLFD